MSAKIFKKIMGLTLAFCIGIVTFCFYYTLQIHRAKEVALQKNFYFLVSTDSRVEAGAEFTKLNGGAGYLLQTEAGQWVALAVYCNEEDGLAVQEGLGDAYSTELVHRGVRSLYFKGKQKRNSTLYVNALRLLEGYVSVLEECIARLEDGATQESCKRILALLGRQFAFAEREYQAYPAFSAACGKWSQKLKEMEEKTLYLKDLRYLLCEQVEKYLWLCEEFRI